MAVKILYKKNDNLIIVEGLQSSLTNEFKNTATVMATLYDSAGLAVAGATDVVLVYQTDTNGNYIGEVQETFDPTAGTYNLVIDANQDGVYGHWEVKTKVKVRKV